MFNSFLQMFVLTGLHKGFSGTLDMGGRRSTWPHTRQEERSVLEGRAGGKLEDQLLIVINQTIDSV